MTLPTPARGLDPRRRGGPKRVVIVEDSTVQRAHLRRVIEADGDLVVVEEAATAPDALVAARRARPHVITIDLDIPGGGIEAIRSIMAHRPTPLLVVSAAVGGFQAASVVEALAVGAADALPKPGRWTKKAEMDLRERLRLLAGLAIRPTGAAPSTGSDVVVALAASTGGPAALSEVLAGVGQLDSAILIVQHLHPQFGPAFTGWMSRSTHLPVREAVHGRPVTSGEVVIAPGGTHLRLGPHRRLVLSKEPSSVHRPSADELFRSVADEAGPRAVGVVLTGMGRDGATGLLAMRRAGATTMVQNEATSAVFGMPRAALAAKAADTALPLSVIGAAVRRAVERLTVTP